MLATDPKSGPALVPRPSAQARRQSGLLPNGVDGSVLMALDGPLGTV
jgi:hypothetical protein